MQLNLSDTHNLALIKFRNQIQDVVKANHDDYYLLRWLRARQWNVDAAETMFRESMKWRERWGADDIENCELPKIVVDYSPVGQAGFDKEGSPIIVIPFAGFDIYGMLHAVSVNDIYRHRVKFIESVLKMGEEKYKETNNLACRQIVSIVDMQNFSLRPYLWGPSKELTEALTTIFTDNYPEILKQAFIINAPKIFQIAFNFVKPFIDEYTISKLHIYSSDQRKWLPEILKLCDASQIPAALGGEMTDPDGNPYCITKINWGGKIPKSLYRREEDRCSSDFEYVKAEIKRGNKMQLDFLCDKTGSILKWEFRTYDYDIKFGIKCKNAKTGEIHVEIPLKRVAAHELIESGFITCHAGFKYTVTFDNSYSYFTSKKIKYFVMMIPLEE